RVENKGVEAPALLREPPEPVEGVAVDELVTRRINLVEEKIAPAPLQVFFGEIEARDARPRPGGANGKTAGVGKGVQNLRSRRPIGKERKFRRDVLHQN